MMTIEVTVLYLLKWKKARAFTMISSRKITPTAMRLNCLAILNSVANEGVKDVLMGAAIKGKTDNATAKVARVTATASSAVRNGALSAGQMVKGMPREMLTEIPQTKAVRRRVCGKRKPVPTKAVDKE